MSPTLNIPSRRHGSQKHFPKFNSTMYLKVKTITQFISVF